MQLVAPDRMGLALDEGLWNLDLAPAPVKERCLLFDVCSQKLAVSIKTLQDVLTIGSITPLPSTPDWVLGLTNVRGTVVGVIDLARFLGLGMADHRTGRLLVCRSGPRTVALAVDGAQRIIDHTPTDVTPMEGLSGRMGRYVRGVVSVDGESIPLLDLGHMLADDAMIHG